MHCVAVSTISVIFLALLFTCQCQDDICGANLLTKIACHRLCDVDGEEAFRAKCVTECCTGGGASSLNATAACNCSERTTAQPNDATTVANSRKGGAGLCPSDWETQSDLKSSSLAGGKCPPWVELQTKDLPLWLRKKDKRQPPACHVRCICDTATGDWQWHWANAAERCGKLGDLVQTKHPKALKHRHCGGLAIRNWDGKVCPIGCIARWIQFVDTGKYFCGKEEEVQLKNG